MISWNFNEVKDIHPSEIDNILFRWRAVLALILNLSLPERFQNYWPAEIFSFWWNSFFHLVYHYALTRFWGICWYVLIRSLYRCTGCNSTKICQNPNFIYFFSLSNLLLVLVILLFVPIKIHGSTMASNSRVFHTHLRNVCSFKVLQSMFILILL